MIRQPFYVKTFGTIRIKIWCYPKEILRSLLLGLRRNSNTINQVFDVLSFRHRYDNMNGVCNCADKIECICMKYSVNAYRFNKIFIPLEIIDCENSCYKCFICEIKSLNMNYCEHTNEISVVSDKMGTVNCLLKLKYDNSYNCVDNVMQKSNVTQIKSVYENIIKDLINRKCCCSKYKIQNGDDDGLFCLNKNKLNAKSFDDIHFKCQDKSTNRDFCEKFESNPVYYHHNPNLCRQKIKKIRMRSKSPINHCSSCDEDQSERSKSASPCSDEHSDDKIPVKCKSILHDDYSEREKTQNDISEIKCLLKTLMNSVNYDENKLNDKANVILQKFLCDIQCKMNNYNSRNYQGCIRKRSPSINEESIDNCFELRHQIYSYLPNLIPTIRPNKKNNEQFPIIDASSNGNATEMISFQGFNQYLSTDYPRPSSLLTQNGSFVKNSSLKSNNGFKGATPSFKQQNLQFDGENSFTTSELVYNPTAKQDIANDTEDLKLKQGNTPIKKSCTIIDNVGPNNLNGLNAAAEDKVKLSKPQATLSLDSAFNENHNTIEAALNNMKRASMNTDRKKFQKKVNNQCMPSHNYIL